MSRALHAGFDLHFAKPLEEGPLVAGVLELARRSTGDRVRPDLGTIVLPAVGEDLEETARPLREKDKAYRASRPCQAIPT